MLIQKYKEQDFTAIKFEANSKAPMLLLEFVASYNATHSFNFIYTVELDQSNLGDSFFVIKTQQNKIATALFFYIKDNL